MRKIAQLLVAESPRGRLVMEKNVPEPAFSPAARHGYNAELEEVDHLPRRAAGVSFGLTAESLFF